MEKDLEKRREEVYEIADVVYKDAPRLNRNTFKMAFLYAMDRHMEGIEVVDGMNEEVYNERFWRAVDEWKEKWLSDKGFRNSHRKMINVALED